MSEEEKDLAYYKEKSEADMKKVPMSVFRYIIELEKELIKANG